MAARVLIVGQDPDTVDYAAPGIIPGMTAQKVRAGMSASKAALETAGHTCEILEVQPDPPGAQAAIQAALAAQTYDVVVIGAGIRNPPPKLLLFETVVNAVMRAAPAARIAFNTRPDDSDAAALRWVDR